MPTAPDNDRMYPQEPSAPQWLPDFSYDLPVIAQVPGPADDLVDALRRLAGKAAAQIDRPRASPRSEAGLHRRAEQRLALAGLLAGANGLADALEQAERSRSEKLQAENHALGERLRAERERTRQADQEQWRAKQGLGR